MTRQVIIPPSLARACITLGLACSTAATAADGITGGWKGARADWAEKGIALDLGYTVEAARNLSGGGRKTDAHAGQLRAGAEVDLQQLWGWAGVRAQLSVSLRDGDNLTDRAGLGSLMQSQEVYGRGNIARLGSLWMARRSADGRLELKVGRLAVGEDFNTLDCIAMNLALCGSQPAVFAGDYWFNSPLSQWGGVLAVSPTANTYLRAGAYQINPRYAATRGGGLRFAPSGTVGTLTPVEAGWEPARNGLKGRYALGGWYSSARRADAAQPPAVPGVGQVPLVRSGAYGGWISAQQQLTRGHGADERAGLRLQSAFAQGDRRTGTIDQMFNVQLIQTGLGASRPDDRIGVGLAGTRVNPRAARSAPRRDGEAMARREYVAEVFYGWRALAGLDLQPGVQYVRHPGGSGARPDALVVGLKADIRF